MNKFDMASISFSNFSVFLQYQFSFVFRACWRFQENLETNPMDQALGLRGSLLPHREDNIPELEPMLVPVLNFEYFHIGIYTNSPAKV